MPKKKKKYFEGSKGYQLREYQPKIQSPAEDTKIDISEEINDI